MWFQLLSVALVAQISLAAIHKPGSKFPTKLHQNGSKYENGRGPYFYNSGQEAGLTSSGKKTPVREMITKYRFQGPTTSGVTTGCVITVEPDKNKKKMTTYFVIDSTGQEQIAVKGRTVRMTFPGPAFFPGLTRSHSVYFHEMCFPAQCGSGTCGFVTGPVTTTRSSVTKQACPPPVTPPTSPTPCENSTLQEGSSGPDDPLPPVEDQNPGADTSNTPDNAEPPTPPEEDTQPRPSKPESKPTNSSTKILPKPDPCPDDKNATKTPEPCPDDPETPVLEKPVPSSLPTPPRSRPSSASSTAVKSTKPAKLSNTEDEDILAKLHKLISLTHRPPQRVPPGGNSFLFSTADENQSETTKPADETEAYYSGLPGAVRGHTGAIYYPSCSATAFRQVAITPFCDTRRMRNRRKNVFSDAVPQEDLQLFGL